jgi:hypothetical protein
MVRIGEDDLIDQLDDALKRFPEARVINLSLSMLNQVCRDNEFSPFAIALDERQKKHDVMFVTTGGNLARTTPPRAWPKQTYYGDAERICSPGDAVRPLAVGGIAHLDSPVTCARSGDPSPRERRTPA